MKKPKICKMTWNKRGSMRQGKDLRQPLEFLDADTGNLVELEAVRETWNNRNLCSGMCYFRKFIDNDWLLEQFGTLTPMKTRIIGLEISPCILHSCSTHDYKIDEDGRENQSIGLYYKEVSSEHIEQEPTGEDDAT